MNSETKTFIESKITNFYNAVKPIIKKDIEQLDKLKENYLRILLFISLIKKDSMEDNIKDFIKKININNTQENYNLIEQYYNLFLDLQNELINKNI